MKTDYQENIQLENIARAMSTNREISVKYATEICRELKGKPVQKALNFLQDVIDQRRYLPMRMFVRNIPHRRGESQSNVKSGRFPVKACEAFIALIESAKNNANQKGLDESALIVRHVFASYGFRRQFMQSKGHIGGKLRQHKSAHIEIILQEAAGMQAQGKGKANAKKKEAPATAGVEAKTEKAQTHTAEHTEKKAAPKASKGKTGEHK